jgi:hypothetical protein
MLINLICSVRNADLKSEPPMIVVFAVTAWILVVSLVAGLCAASRAGDLAQLGSVRAPRGEGSVWEPFEHLEISAHATGRQARSAESGATLRHGNGIAA